MSPAMAAAAAVTGKLTDVRKLTLTLVQPNTASPKSISPAPPPGWEYASFSRRALAFSIDQIILMVIVLALMLPLIILMGLGTMIAWPFVTIFFLPPTWPISTTVAWIYYALQESGRHRGTFGKRMCGLSVVDMGGKRITFLRASARFFAKFISSAIMLVGYIMAAFTERHQALHDLIAETLVVKKAKRKLMQKFTKLTGVAAPLPMVNVDTDAIIPKQFLKTIKRSGLGQYLFNDLRFTPEGKEISDFVLNKASWREAQILITGANFGCGSSREHAPWALQDFGIRCVIAPSFADIFLNNCFKNGVLPVVLPQAQVDQLMEMAKNGAQLTVDLEAQCITAYPQNINFSFKTDPFRRECMLNGLDDIGLTEKNGTKIDAYENRQKMERSWI